MQQEYSNKYTTHNFSLKNLTNQGEFTGYASIFNIADQQNDVILPGAFRKTINQQNYKKIKLLWQHDHNQPIGVFSKIMEDATGLYVEGNLLLDVTKGKEVYSLLQAGAINDLSNA